MDNLYRLIPLKNIVLHEDLVDCFICEGELTEDFGQWNKGDTKVLTFNFLAGTVTEFDNDGNEIVSMEFRLRIKDG